MTVKKKVTVKNIDEIKDVEQDVKKENKQAKLHSLVNELNKKFGTNAVYLGFPKDSEGNTPKVKRIKTGSVSLDAALGGGIPEGRYTEISGSLSSTKTSQALHIIREAQQAGYVCALLDVEATTDEEFVRSFGIDPTTLIYSRPASTEEATQVMLNLQKSKIAHLGVLDSLAAMSPNKEQESDMDETVRLGITPNLLNEFFRKYQMNNNRLSREGAVPFTLICINQLRESIGQYVEQERSPGGRGKGFTATVDLRLRKSEWIAEGTGENKAVVGQVVSFKIDKNKLYRRMVTGSFDYYFAENEAGVKPFYNDYIKDIVVCAIKSGIMQRTGAWFLYGGKKWQGLKSVIDEIRDDEELLNLMYNELMKKLTK